MTTPRRRPSRARAPARETRRHASARSNPAARRGLAKSPLLVGLGVLGAAGGVALLVRAWRRHHAPPVTEVLGDAPAPDFLASWPGAATHATHRASPSASRGNAAPAPTAAAPASSAPVDHGESASGASSAAGGSERARTIPGDDTVTSVARFAELSGTSYRNAYQAGVDDPNRVTNN